MCASPASSTHRYVGNVRRTERQDKLLALLCQILRCRVLERRQGVLHVTGAAIGAVCLLYVVMLPPPLLLCKSGTSVSQDDFHKASHVGLFGLMGGEEGMLLRRKISLFCLDVSDLVRISVI